MLLQKISLAALFCISPLLMTDSATAGHGCHHSVAAATAYRAPVGHSHARHGHHHHAHHYAPPATCCGGAPAAPAYAPAYQAHVPATAYGSYYGGPAMGGRAYGMAGGYGAPVLGRSQAIGGRFGAGAASNPFAGGRLDLRVGGPRFGY